MPRVRFLLIRCPNCGEEHKVRLERVDSGLPLECLACGATVPVGQYVPLLQALNAYSTAVLEVEKHGKVDGEVLILPREVRLF